MHSGYPAEPETRPKTEVYVITILARFIDHRYFNGPSDVTSLEWTTLEILAVLVIVFEGLHLLLPSEKNRTIKKIREHFNTAAS